MASDLVNPDALNSTIEFLTAMVTPALLISATGSLVLSTSTRLGRVVDRVRQLEERLSDLIYAGIRRGQRTLPECLLPDGIHRPWEDVAQRQRIHAKSGGEDG